MWLVATQCNKLARDMASAEPVVGFDWWRIVTIATAGILVPIGRWLAVLASKQVALEAWRDGVDTDIAAVKLESGLTHDAVRDLQNDVKHLTEDVTGGQKLILDNLLELAKRPSNGG